MLAVTVKKGEPIWVGDDIVVFVLEVHGKQIRVGIDAPKDVRILRDDVRRRMLEDGFDSDTGDA
jgi:carbon storage regulator